MTAIISNGTLKNSRIQMGPIRTNLQMQFDGSDFSTIRPLNEANGGTISEWLDKSGNGNHAVQATAGAQPLYSINAISGIPAVYFDTPGTVLQTPYDWPLEYDVFVVFQPITLPLVTSSMVMVSSHDGAGSHSDGEYTLQLRRLASTIGGQHVAFNAANIRTEAKPFVAGQPSIQRASANSSKLMNYYFNNVVDPLTEIHSSVLTRFPVAIGDTRSPIASASDHMMGEILFYDRKLTDSEAQHNTDYFNNKWRIGI